MSYKHVLLDRHFASGDGIEEDAPLDYIALRNRDALRAWHERCLGVPVTRETDRKRHWLRRLAFWARTDTALYVR